MGGEPFLGPYDHGQAWLAAAAGFSAEAQRQGHRFGLVPVSLLETQVGDPLEMPKLRPGVP